jgi:hypothetical protein
MKNIELKSLMIRIKKNPKRPLMQRGLGQSKNQGGKTKAELGSEVARDWE